MTISGQESRAPSAPQTAGEQTLASLAFTKMSGCGNDFILIDNRDGALNRFTASALARSLCRRRLSVGADGLILIENDPELDFRWRFHNSDGSEAEMCGNGARCAARFAFLKGIGGGRRLRFRTLAGVIRAEILDGDTVRVQATEPSLVGGIERLSAGGRDFRCRRIDTGVPHAVVFVDGLEALRRLDVQRYGEALRWHSAFAPQGSNVDFVALVNPRQLAVRTYERGVEQETLACGTGAIAAALVAAEEARARTPVEVTTSGGQRLTIHFQRGAEGFTEVYLEGEARVVYEGRIGDPLTVA